MTRYDKMISSTVLDEDGESWPDPLSVTYGNDIKVLPTVHRVSAVDIAKFWVAYYNQYAVTEGDDMLLSRNGVPYIGMLKPGDEIYFFDVNDLENIEYQEP
jgi:hypothetical protein